jgi:geranylgeranyl pyrophosphate synthase
MRSGLITAPVVYAYIWLQKHNEEEKQRELYEMMKRKFSKEGDVEQTVKIIEGTGGIKLADTFSINLIDKSLENLASLGLCQDFSLDH